MATLSPGPHDLLVLQELFHSRVALRRHLSALCFNDKPEACKKRLQKLIKAGFVVERRSAITAEGRLFLGEHGIDELVRTGVLSDYRWLTREALARRADVSEVTVAHELEVVDLKLAFRQALAAEPDHSLQRFVTWSRLMSFKAPADPDAAFGGDNVWVYPDGYLEIVHDDPNDPQRVRRYFLEHDRSKKHQSRFLEQLLRYRAHYETNGLAARLDLPGTVGFLLLVVCRSAGRRNNTLVHLVRESVKGLIWTTTFDEVRKDPLGAIWVRPTDYLVATEGSSFDPWTRDRVDGSEPERDAFVDARVEKRRLLDV